MKIVLLQKSEFGCELFRTCISLRLMSFGSRSYFAGYGVILIVLLVLYTGNQMVYMHGTIRASRFIHRKLIDAILGTTLRFARQP